MLTGRCHAIIWTSAGILLIRPLWTNFKNILIKIYIFIRENAFENVIWKIVGFFVPASMCYSIIYVVPLLLLHGMQFSVITHCGPGCILIHFSLIFYHHLIGPGNKQALFNQVCYMRSNLSQSLRYFITVEEYQYFDELARLKARDS